MKLKFKDLVDVETLQQLTDDLYTATGIPSAIITMDGEIFTGSGWQRICTDFHRRNPLIERDCIASDIAIRKAMDAGEPYVMYRCPRGLVDASTPIVIEGEHVANVFAGQLFTEQPDAATEEFFRQQARVFGLDEEAYIEAFREVPVVPEEKFRPALSFLAKFANMVGSMGLARLREREALEQSKRSELSLKDAQRVAGVGSWVWHVPTNSLEWSDEMYHIFGIEKHGFAGDLGDVIARAIHPGDRAAVEQSNVKAAQGRPEALEYRVVRPDGTMRTLLGQVGEFRRDAEGHVVEMRGVVKDISDSKRAEETIRRKAEELNEAQRVAGVGSWEWDLGANKVTWSDGLFRILGLDPATPVPPFAEMVPFYAPESWERLSAVVATAVQTGAPYELDLEEIRADGAHIWTTTRGEAMRGPSGEITGLRGTVLDVTKRRQDQEAVLQSQGLLRSVADGTPDAVFVKDVDGRYLFVNSAVARFAGKPIEELLGNDDTALFPPDHARLVMENDRRVMAGATETLEEELFAGGVARTFLATKGPVRDARGNVIGLFGISRDITDRKRADEALRASEQRLREAQRVARVGSWELDLAALAVAWSESLCRMVGRDPLLPAPAYADLHRYYTPESWERLGAAVQVALATGAGYELDLEVIREDGSHWWQTARGEAVRSPTGEVVRLQGTVLDITERRLAEEALKESAQRLRAAQRVGGMGSWELDAQTSKVYWSEGYYQLMGRDPSLPEPTSEEFRRLYTPESWDQLIAATDSAITRGEPYELELEGFRENGERWWQAARGEAVRSENGKIVRLQGTVLDITARKRNEAVNASRMYLVQFSLSHDINEMLEETLNEAERLTGSLISGSHFVEDDQINLTLQNWSTRTKAQFCKAEGQGLHYPVADAGIWADCIRERRPVIHDDYMSEPNRRGLPEGHAAVTRELFVPVIRNGLVKAMMGIGNKPTSYTQEDVDVVSLLANLAWDAIERMRAEETQRVFLELMETSPAMVTIHDTEGGFLWVNDGALKLHGYTREEFLALNLRVLDVPASAELIAGRMRLLQRDGTASFEVEHFRKDASLLPLWVTARATKWNNRDVILSVGTDLTERRRTEESERQLERLLRETQKSEAVLTLAGGIAHDFNNLLTVVICNADLACKNLHPDSPILANLRAVVAGASRAADLTQQLLAYTGSSPGDAASVNISKLARETVDTMRAALPLGARLEVELDEAIPSIEGDETDLHRVLVNLLVNASEALGDGAGVISVRTGVVPADAASAPAGEGEASSPGRTQVFLEVTDTGCGMDANTRERIFEPFFSTKFLGRGLGLAATAGIVSAHQGEITVTSAPGEGSTFRVRFPAAGTGLVDRPRPEAAPWRGKGTVLVIDDQAAIRSVAAEMLVKHGLKVITASDGEEGLREFDEHREEIVLVLLDLVMPRMHGTQALAELRRRVPDLPVVILTGLPSEARKLGMPSSTSVPLLRKPFTMDALIAQVRAALGETAAAAAP